MARRPTDEQFQQAGDAIAPQPPTTDFESDAQDIRAQIDQEAAGDEGVNNPIIVNR